MQSPDLQPFLKGQSLELRPLKIEDHEELFKAASDPLIWEQHPQSNRYKSEVFQVYFQGALESLGAFAIIDRQTQKIIGSSRYYDYRPELKSIAIGYTFLDRAHWGGNFNYELKKLMLDHAFQFVDKVEFHIGVSNLRSQKALQKLGGRLIGETMLNGSPHLVFEINQPLP